MHSPQLHHFLRKIKLGLNLHRDSGVLNFLKEIAVYNPKDFRWLNHVIKSQTYQQLELKSLHKGFLHLSTVDIWGLENSLLGQGQGLSCVL